MHSLFSLITAGAMLFSATAAQRESASYRPLTADLNDVQDAVEPFKEERPKDHEALKGTWNARWGSYASDIKRSSNRERFGGDLQRCVQIAEKTRQSPGARCERLKDYIDLLERCAVDMNVSTHCFPLEQQVVDWDAAKRAGQE